MQYHLSLKVMQEEDFNLSFMIKIKKWFLWKIWNDVVSLYLKL